MKSNDVNFIPELIKSIQQEAVEKYKKEHRWIPITERMPKEEEYILVSFENCALPNIGRYENDGKSDKFYPGNVILLRQIFQNTHTLIGWPNDEKTYASYGLIVNAWMPLPEPYKGGVRIWNN